MNILNVALAVPLADMHDIGAGWWIVMIPMMVLVMGAMMWMMMRGMGGSSSRDDSSAPKDRFVSSPIETLEHRLADGDISIEEYRERREALVNGAAESSGDRAKEQIAAPRSEEGRR
jgi:uncharacterized membrane protein